MLYIYMRPRGYKTHWCHTNLARENIESDPGNLVNVARNGVWLQTLNASLADAFVSEPEGAIALDVNEGQQKKARREVNAADAAFTAAHDSGDLTGMLESAQILWESLEDAYSRGPQEHKPTAEDNEGTDKP